MSAPLYFRWFQPIFSHSRAASLSNVSFTKSVSTASVTVGGQFTYTLSIVNNNAAAVKNIVINDPLPTGLGFVSASDSGTVQNGSVIWNISSIAAGATKQVTLTVISLAVLNPPANPIASAVSCSRININWTNNSSGQDAFAIQRGTDSSFISPTQTFLTPSAAATSYTDRWLKPSSQYYYRVSSYQFLTLTGSAVPSNLTVSINGGSVEKDLSWKDNSSNEQGFIIDRSTSSNFSTDLFSILVSQNTVSYADTNLSDATATYYYRVKAVRFIGQSGQGTTVSASTDTTLLAPTNLTTTIISSNEVDIYWQDNTDRQVGYWIDRSTNADFSNKITFANFTHLTQHNETALNPNTKYYFRVYAWDTSGEVDDQSPPSAVITATTPSGGQVLSPSNLHSTAIYDAAVDLAWNVTYSSIDDLNIEYSTDQTFANIENSVSIDKLARSYRITDLTANTTYYFRITASINNHTTDPSNVLTVKTTNNGSIPDPGFYVPTNLVATPVSSTQINLTWTDNSTTENSYSVERSTDPNFIGSSGYSLPANTTSFASTGLTANTTYYYRVTVWDSSGTKSLTSPTVSAKTKS